MPGASGTCGSPRRAAWASRCTARPLPTARRCSGACRSWMPRESMLFGRQPLPRAVVSLAARAPALPHSGLAPWLQAAPGAAAARGGAGAGRARRGGAAQHAAHAAGPADPAGGRVQQSGGFYGPGRLFGAVGASRCSSHSGWRPPDTPPSTPPCNCIPHLPDESAGGAGAGAPPGPRFRRLADRAAPRGAAAAGGRGGAQAGAPAHASACICCCALALQEGLPAALDTAARSIWPAAPAPASNVCLLCVTLLPGLPGV